MTIVRHLAPRILNAMQDTPIVYLQGARQTGKSTLVQLLAENYRHAQYLSLDVLTVLAAAQGDPEGFVEGLASPAIIDEVQRAPQLARAIKSSVDKDRRAGRFLLTGSAGVLALPRIAQSLVGRVELHTLWPFSQGEIDGQHETFVERVFRPKLNLPDPLALTQTDVITRLLAGGYPEAVSRKDAQRQHAWFDSYVTTVVGRDVRELANIEKLSEVPRLLALLASRTGALLNYADLGRSLSISQSTLKRYMALLEATFLLRLVPAWFKNVGKRLTKSPRLFLSDTGLVAYSLGLDAERLRNNRTVFGHLLENFVAMELTKQLTWSSVRATLFHFRTEAGREVDFVLETASGQIVGVEVKAAASVDHHDLEGLRVLAEVTGEQFTRGVLLYLGDTLVPFSKQFWAVPLGMLWA